MNRFTEHGSDHARDLAEEAAKDPNELTQELPKADPPPAHLNTCNDPEAPGFGITGRMRGEQSNTVSFGSPEFARGLDPAGALLGSFMRPEPFAAEPMLQFFQYAHLSVRLQMVSMPFCQLANSLVDSLPRNPERTVALRKLLEAKDCAVRALLYVSVDGPARAP